jgi:hypothetical protein
MVPPMSHEVLVLKNASSSLASGEAAWSIVEVVMAVVSFLRTERLRARSMGCRDEG